jgi:hypothetical protein
VPSGGHLLTAGGCRGNEFFAQIRPSCKQ